jgi:2-polyprenyl-3-methyl-5-hydroxy-6-metoxy-1,4-benzoquinol methylase
MSTQTERDHNQEYMDLTGRKYAYDFDYLLRDYMMQTFEPFLPTGRALEMGCYKGEFTRKLALRYSDLTVIEAASDLILLASENIEQGTRVKFIHSTFETVQLDEKFDAIFLIHTLEHLDDPIEVLGRIKNWLTDEGLLFLVVPNANAPSRQIAVKMGLIAHNSAVTDGESAHGHRRTYSLDTLEHDVRSAGLKVRNRGGILFKPLANYQFDAALESGIITNEYVKGCYELGMQYPDLCASIYLLCSKGEQK